MSEVSLDMPSRSTLIRPTAPSISSSVALARLKPSVPTWVWSAALRTSSTAWSVSDWMPAISSPASAAD